MTNQHDNVVDDFWEAVLVHQGLNKPIVVRRERYPKGTMSEAIPKPCTKNEIAILGLGQGLRSRGMLHETRFAPRNDPSKEG